VIDYSKLIVLYCPVLSSSVLCVYIYIYVVDILKHNTALAVNKSYMI